MDVFVQFLFGGLTVGAMYAFVALGFVLLYNVSGIINFAQGEFIMLGGMAAAAFVGLGIPVLVAVLLAMAVAVLVSVVLKGLSSFVLRRSTLLEVIIMTVAAAMVIRGSVQVLMGTKQFSLPGLGGDEPALFFGAAILQQSLWLLLITFVVLGILGWFFRRSRAGKAILAVAYNAKTAQMMGINASRVVLICFALSAFLGALAGVLITPISLTSYDSGLMVGLKGIVAAILGGMGSVFGAVVGGLLLGLAEAMTAGYITSRYKDAIPFLAVLVILVVWPNGLFGKAGTERV